MPPIARSLNLAMEPTWASMLNERSKTLSIGALIRDASSRRTVMRGAYARPLPGPLPRAVSVVHGVHDKTDLVRSVGQHVTDLRP